MSEIDPEVQNQHSDDFEDRGSKCRAFESLHRHYFFLDVFWWFWLGSPERNELSCQRHGLNSPGREVVQVRVEFDPGYIAPRHTHHGEEIIYVLEGTLVYYIEGKPPATVHPGHSGDVLFVPAGTIHSVKNIGNSKGAELATYVVEKGKPLVELEK